MKKKQLRYLWFFLPILVIGLSIAIQSARTDHVSHSGSFGPLRGIDLISVDSVGNVHISTSASQDMVYISTINQFDVWSADISLGASFNTPSTTAGNYPGLAIQIYNGNANAWAQGTVVLSSASSNTTGHGTFAAVLATTTVIGISTGAVASGTVGFMKVSGWALVLTTGAVSVGDILVSTDGSVAAGAAGYAGVDNSPAAGAEIGVAMSQGTAAGGLTLVKLR